MPPLAAYVHCTEPSAITAPVPVGPVLPLMPGTMARYQRPDFET
jgi:hypothetical protein